MRCSNNLAPGSVNIIQYQNLGIRNPMKTGVTGNLLKAAPFNSSKIERLEIMNPRRLVY